MHLSRLQQEHSQWFTQLLPHTLPLSVTLHHYVSAQISADDPLDACRPMLSHWQAHAHTSLPAESKDLSWERWHGKSLLKKTAFICCLGEAVADCCQGGHCWVPLPDSLYSYYMCRSPHVWLLSTSHSKSTDGHHLRWKHKSKRKTEHNLVYRTVLWPHGKGFSVSNKFSLLSFT